jgi:hypothetical protein
VPEDNPSVTEILKPWGPDFSQVPNIEYYQDRGDRLHNLCTGHALGIWVVPEEDIEGYFNSFRRWFDLVDEVFLAETRLTSNTWGFTGRPDLVVRFNNDPRLIVADLKSPLAYHKVWALQTSGYKILFEENFPGLEIERWGSLRLRKDGGVAIFNEATQEDVRAFIAATIIHKHMKGGTQYVEWE